MVREAYCSQKISKLLKEKGFDELCMFKYNADGTRVKAGVAIDEWTNSELEEDECSAPTHQRAMAWLREQHRVLISIDAYHADHYEGLIDSFEIDIIKNASRIIVPHEIAIHNEYDDAVEMALYFALTKLIEITSNKLWIE